MIVFSRTLSIVEDTLHKREWPAAKLGDAGAALVALH